MLFKNIFDGSSQESSLAAQAASTIHSFIPGEWSIRQRADPELFEGIPDEPQDPKIVSEESAVGLAIAKGFLERSFANFDNLAKSQQETNQDPTTVTDTASSTLDETAKHVHAEPTSPSRPERPDVRKPDTPTPQPPPRQ